MPAEGKGKMAYQQISFLTWFLTGQDVELSDWDKQDHEAIQAWSKSAEKMLDVDPNFFFTDGHTDLGDNI
jgi:hypothetical protein